MATELPQFDNIGYSADRLSSNLEPVQLIADTVGQLMEFWGFKHIMGRLWTILFLSSRPLSAPELAERLHSSSGGISMALHDLMTWGAIRKVCLPQSRKDHYVAENNIWKLVSRVLSEREGRRIEAALDSMDLALGSLKKEANSPPQKPEETRFQIERLEELQKLGELARKLLKLLIIGAKIDTQPIRHLFEKKLSETNI